jgi:hypothetical protein
MIYACQCVLRPLTKFKTLLIEMHYSKETSPYQLHHLSSSVHSLNRLILTFCLDIHNLNSRLVFATSSFNCAASD